MRKFILFIVIFLFFSLAGICFGNTGIFNGSGNQVIPIKNDQIQLVRENVDIRLSIDKKSSKLGNDFIPWANVTAKFIFKNTTKDKVSLQMGFPFLDLQGFGDEEFVFDNLNFKVISDGEEINTTLKEGLIEKEFDPDGLFKKVFAWQDDFKIAELKEVVVTYRMMMGVTSVNSISRDFNEQGKKFSDIDRLISALSFNFDYITKTAYTWAGSIEKADFTLDCNALYKEFEPENFKAGLGKNAPSFSRPIFLEATYPDSAIKKNGIYQWTFRESVPEEGLSIVFIILSLPSLPEEVNKYFNLSLKRLKGVNHDEFKSILYAYYQNIAFDKQPSESFSQRYFQQNGLMKMPKNIIFHKDKMNIVEIANNFNALIKQ